MKPNKINYSRTSVSLRSALTLYMESMAFVWSILLYRTRDLWFFARVAFWDCLFSNHVYRSTFSAEICFRTYCLIRAILTTPYIQHYEFDLCLESSLLYRLKWLSTEASESVRRHVRRNFRERLLYQVHKKTNIDSWGITKACDPYLVGIHLRLELRFSSLTFFLFR